MSATKKRILTPEERRAKASQLAKKVSSEKQVHDAIKSRIRAMSADALAVLIDSDKSSPEEKRLARLNLASRKRRVGAGQSSHVLQVRISRELRERLAVHANRCNMDVSGLVRQALENELYELDRDQDDDHE